MPALADGLFSWTVPIEGLQGREGWVRDGWENCSKVGDGRRVSSEEHQFRHVVQANLLFFFLLFFSLSGSVSLPSLLPRFISCPVTLV